MSTRRINDRAPLVRSLVERGLFAGEPLVLADVGVSGGLPSFWRQFEPHFRAFGFDPLIRECERLNREEKNKAVEYHDYFLGYPEYEQLFPNADRGDPVKGWSNQPFERTSAARAQRLQSMTIQQWFNNENPDVVFTERRISLDEFFAARSEKVDFIKVDTDGHDYEVLCGARRILKDHQVLGLLVETQFHGITHPHSNLFANIDRLLREHGFSLFDLETYRYTRGVLPGRFEYSMAAQTKEGQILAADALYLRDISAPGYDERWRQRLSDSKLLKLAALFDVFGLPDCAAELLSDRQQQLATGVDLPTLLDLLAREIQPGMGGYAEVNKRFDASREAFYPHTPTELLRRHLPTPLRRMLSRLKRKLRG